MLPKLKLLLILLMLCPLPEANNFFILTCYLVVVDVETCYLLDVP